MPLVDSTLLLVAALGLLQQIPQAVVASQLRCSPSTVRAGDVVTLQLPESPRSELAVQSPSGLWLFIAFLPVPAGPDPKIDSAELKRMRGGSLTVQVGDFSAVPLNPLGPERQIFVEPGIYRFVVADRIETQNNAESCEVRFVR